MDDEKKQVYEETDKLHDQILDLVDGKNGRFCVGALMFAFVEVLFECAVDDENSMQIIEQCKTLYRELKEGKADG